MKEEKASELIERHLLGEASPEEERELFALLEASPELREENEEMETLIGALRELRMKAPPGFLSRVKGSIPRKTRYLSFVERELKYAVLAASILLMIAAGIFGLLYRGSQTNEVTEIKQEPRKGYIMQIEPRENGGIYFFTVSEDNSM